MESTYLQIVKKPYDLNMAAGSCSGGCSSCGGSCACGTVGSPGSCGSK